MQPLPSSAPQLIYLAFGAKTYHQEACFSIVSALAQLKESGSQALDIQVHTDDPAPYAKLPVTVHLICDATRAAWAQPHGYHFRSKHVLLRQALEQHSQAVLIDTDTFFRQSPMELLRRVKPGHLLCNAICARYGENPNTDLYQGLRNILHARGLADDHMNLVNSGVIGLAAEDSGALDQSIALMDEFHPIVPNAYTLEEFCLAVAAYRTLTLTDCTDVIHHYWSRKDLFRAKIQAWLHKHGDDPLGEAALADVALVNDRLPKPPTLHRLGYKALSLTLPRHQRQFARELLYGCYPYANEFDRACTFAWWDKALENLQQRQGRLNSEQLHQLLHHPGLRLSLGSKYQDVRDHLLKPDKG